MSAGQERAVMGRAVPVSPAAIVGAVAVAGYLFSARRRRSATRPS
jgi:hypothetical protein